jgi:hypothetical protein
MLGNELLDENTRELVRTQANLTNRRIWWRKFSTVFLATFGLSFGILLFILYFLTIDDLQYFFGDIINPRYLAVGLLAIASLSAFVSAIFVLRTLLLPFDYGLPQSECQSALTRSAMLFLILLLAFGIIPILLFYTISIEDFGDAIGVKPANSGREFSFISFVAACIWGGYFLILVLMQSIRALTYRQKTAEIL